MTVYRNAMLDIETLSTHTHNALVLSIGIVRFNIDHWRPGASEPNMDLPGSQVTFDVREQLLWGREVDPKTQKFWQQQGSEAQDAWVDGHALDTNQGLTDLELCLYSGMEDEDCAAFKVWANGIVFDLGNIESLYHHLGRKPRWPYNAARDSRTIRDMFPLQRTRPDDISTGAAHLPVDDCISQIWTLWERWPDGEMAGPSSVAKAAW